MSRILLQLANYCIIQYVICTSMMWKPETSSTHTLKMEQREVGDIWDPAIQFFNWFFVVTVVFVFCKCIDLGEKCIMFSYFYQLYSPSQLLRPQNTTLPEDFNGAWKKRSQIIISIPSSKPDLFRRLTKVNGKIITKTIHCKQSMMFTVISWPKFDLPHSPYFQ